MIHRQLGMRCRLKAAMSFACGLVFAFVMGGPLGLACAGEFDRSTLPASVSNPAHCDARSDQLGVLKDSGDCRRISGYIAAGAGFGSDDQIGGRPSPFGPLGAPEFVGGAHASGVTIIDAPAGQDRFFLPPGLGDEAR
jgi:hypothetical protein